MRQGSGTTELRSYTYTDNGLLSTANYNSRSIENFWDASGNRVRFVATSGTHTFVYDITAGNPSVIDEDGVYYIREPNGALIARISGTSTSYYHFDELGSTRLITDGTGTVTHKYAYDAYGSSISYYGPANNNQPYQYVGQYGYYTHYQEPEFGLLQLGVRFYDSQVGRFTQEDLARDGLNWYAYCNGNPASYIDPNGKNAACVVMGTIATGVGLAVGSTVAVPIIVGASLVVGIIVLTDGVEQIAEGVQQHNRERKNRPRCADWPFSSFEKALSWAKKKYGPLTKSKGPEPIRKMPWEGDHWTYKTKNKRPVTISCVDCPGFGKKCMVK